jgi:hypothetical protein
MSNQKMIRQYPATPTLAECSRRIGEIKAQLLIEMYGEPEPKTQPAIVEDTGGEQ